MKKYVVFWFCLLLCAPFSSYAKPTISQAPPQNPVAEANAVKACGIRLVVNYSLSPPEMIAAGHYDWVNSDITVGRFPITETAMKEIIVEVVHFGHKISSEDAVTELAKRGLRPPVIAELLAYGAAHPEEQRKYPIVALGSVEEVSGERRVPYLDGHDAGRYLHLGWWGDYYYWGGSFRFLAVRN